MRKLGLFMMMGLGVGACGPAGPPDEGDGGALTAEDLPTFTRTFGQSVDRITALDLGPKGEVLFAGNYTGEINFGGGFLEADGPRSLFLAELDADGSHIWSATTGSQDDQVTGVSIGPAGGMAVSATFNGYVNFGSGVQEGIYDAVFATFTDNADPIYTRHFGTSSPEVAAAVLLTREHHTQVILSTYVPLDVGLGEIPGYWSALVEFDEQGKPLWQLPFAGSDSYARVRIVADKEGNTYVAGTSSQVFTVGEASFTADGYLMKVAPNGALLWATGVYAQDGWLEYSDLAVGPDGEAVLSGRFFGTVDMGGAIQTANDLSAFVLRYDKDGNGTMARHWVNQRAYMDTFVGVGPEGDIWAYGELEESMTIQGETLFDPAGENLYLARFTAGGDLVSALGFGGQSWEAPCGIAIDPAGQPVIAGLFTGPFTIGELSFQGQLGFTKLFVARISPDLR